MPTVTFVNVNVGIYSVHSVQDDDCSVRRAKSKRLTLTLFMHTVSGRQRREQIHLYNICMFEYKDVHFI